LLRVGTPVERIVIRCAVLALLVHAGRPADLSAQVAVSYTIDATGTAIYVVTHRAGLFSFLGHDHAILATQWSGTLCWSPDVPGQGHGTVEVATSALVIDTDTARALAGLGGGPSPGQVRELQTKLLDPDHLDSANYPFITLSVRGMTEAVDNRLVARGQLRIRDRVRDVEFPLDVAAASDSVRFRGVLHVPQTGFGIRPESVAAVIRVADTVDIHFDLLGVSTGVPCSE
jgi:polyisoprenoid-binding protein YceI